MRRLTLRPNSPALEGRRDDAVAVGGFVGIGRGEARYPPWESVLRLRPPVPLGGGRER